MRPTTAGHGRADGEGPDPPWDDGLWPLTAKQARDLSLVMDADWAREVGKELGAGHEEREPILEALRASDLVAFEPAGHDEEQRVWNAYWCLSPLEELRTNWARHFVAQHLKFLRGAASTRRRTAVVYARYLRVLPTVHRVTYT